MTDFYHGNGSWSSSRSSTGVGTTLFSSSGGGSTFRVGNIASRFSSSGRYLGSSYSGLGRTTYFGSSGAVSSHITAY